MWSLNLILAKKFFEKLAWFSSAMQNQKIDLDNVANYAAVFINRHQNENDSLILVDKSYNQ